MHRQNKEKHLNLLLNLKNQNNNKRKKKKDCNKTEFKGRLLFGEIKHTEKSLVNQYNVKSFPAVLVVKPSESQPISFNDKISPENLLKFLNEHAPPKQRKTSQPPPESQKSKQQQTKKEEKPVKVSQITTQDTFDSACLQKASTCILAFLDPQDNDGKTLEKNLDTLKKLAEKYKNLFDFMWTDGPNNMQVVGAYHMDSGFPSLILLSPKKLGFVPFVGTFGVEQLSDFFEKVLKGKKSALELDNGVIPLFPLELKQEEIIVEEIIVEQTTVEEKVEVELEVDVDENTQPSS